MWDRKKKKKKITLLFIEENSVFNSVVYVYTLPSAKH